MFGSDLKSPPFGCKLNEWGCGGSPVIAGNGALKVNSPLSFLMTLRCIEKGRDTVFAVDDATSHEEVQGHWTARRFHVGGCDNRNDLLK